MINKIGVGTVQWGLDYGVSNSTGIVPLNEIDLILKLAKKSDITIIDTAQAYGIAENKLGIFNLNGFKLITKISHKDICITYENLRDNLNISLKKLNIPNIYGVLFHDADEFYNSDIEKLINIYNKLKSEGYISKIGVSLYHEVQAEKLLKIFKPDIIQIPINILDQRFLNNGYLKEFKKNSIEIHARSIFLQGLLLLNKTELPNYFKKYTNELEKIRNAAKQQSMTLKTAAISFVNSINELDYIIVGFQNCNQFKEIIAEFEKKTIFNADNLYSNKQSLINPRLWKL